MATTLADCDRIIEAVERSGQWFSLAFQMRCDPQNIKMRELVRAGELGKLGMVRRRHCIPVLFSEAFIAGPSKWHISREANRGMFFDDATHPMDWLIWTLGRKPVSVMAEIDNVLTNVAPDDTGIAIFRYEDGLFAEVCNTSVTLAGENTTEIYGDKGVSNPESRRQPLLRHQAAPSHRRETVPDGTGGGRLAGFRVAHSRRSRRTDRGRGASVH